MSEQRWRRIARRHYRDFWLAAITITLVLIAGKALDTSSQTHGALCTLRGDLQERVAASNAFLAKHPEGFAGIPAATIRQSAQGQQRTIDALSGLGCRAPVRH